MTTILDIVRGSRQPLRRYKATEQSLHFLLPPKRTPRATKNLRLYLSHTILPTIARHDRSGPYCIPTRRTHLNKLLVRHDSARRLARICQHDPVAFGAAVLAYNNKHIYGRKARPFAGKHYSRAPGEALVLPGIVGKLDSEADYEDIPYPTNIAETCRWVRERPLQTLQRALHVAFPDTTRWWLDDAPPDRDAALWREYVWRFHPDAFHTAWWREGADGGAEPAPADAVVVAVQPPWILGPQDLQNVAECTDLPVPTDPEAPPLTAQQRVWGKLHDSCKARGCRTFVLTNYHGWVFGRFAADWTSARTSAVLKHDAREPTVMQALVYWFAAAMELSDARFWRKPVVEEGEVEVEVHVPLPEAQAEEVTSGEWVGDLDMLEPDVMGEDEDEDEADEEYVRNMILGQHEDEEQNGI